MHDDRQDDMKKSQGWSLARLPRLLPRPELAPAVLEAMARASEPRASSQPSRSLQPGAGGDSKAQSSPPAVPRPAPSSPLAARVSSRLPWVLAASLALVAVIASVFTVLSRTSPTDPVAAVQLPYSAAAEDYAELIQESRRLEQTLMSLPPQRRLMRADTASTIAALETQLAVIDDQLTLSAAAGAEPRFRQGLWRNRVDAMNALVQVRYAQSQEFTY